MEIKVGFLVAYDYELLRHSLPAVYKSADKIVMAIDKERRTFAGGTYELDPSFFSWLKSIDADNKITIYEDDFYIQGLTANEADTRERNMLAKKLGEGGWHFQVDVDEYFINFEALIKDLRMVEDKLKHKKVTIQIACSVLFKKAENGFFIVDGEHEKFSIATNNPEYTFHRNNDVNEKYFINHLILHQSWGRTEDDLRLKLDNWSHHSDFDTESYFNFWKSISSDNYKYMSDFHPLSKGLWKSLSFVQADSLEDVLKNMPFKTKKEPGAWSFRLRNWLPPVIYRKLPASVQV